MNKHVERIQLEVDLDKSEPYNDEINAITDLVDFNRGVFLLKPREQEKRLVKIGLTVVKYLEFLDGIK